VGKGGGRKEEEEEEEEEEEKKDAPSPIDRSSLTPLS
jgi:hypothetical protein